jgi:hypothetical protein
VWIDGSVDSAMDGVDCIDRLVGGLGDGWVDSVDRWIGGLSDGWVDCVDRWIGGLSDGWGRLYREIGRRIG